jgi:hypothetical protein
MNVDEMAQKTMADPVADRTVTSTSTGAVMATGDYDDNDEDGFTQIMQTRAVGRDEIDAIKAMDQKRSRNKMFLYIAGIIVILVIGFIFRPRTPPPEEEIAWTVDEETGNLIDDFFAAPSGGYNDGGYDLMMPRDPNRKITDIAGGFMVELRIGIRRDVPMRMFLQEETDNRFLKMSRDEAVKDWIQMISGSDGNWNFDRPSSTPFFFKKEKGIPFISIPFQRDADGSWSGFAYLFRNGNRRIVLRVEVPSSERLRAERVLMTFFIIPSPEYDRAHWEPVKDLPTADLFDLIRQARRELDRMAPATWAEINTLLRGVLTKAVLTGNTEAEKEALRLLVELRSNQGRWFNSQKFARDNAATVGDDTRVKRIAEFTKGVFSDIDDQRYLEVRQWSR